MLVELLRRETEVGYVRTADGLEVHFLARFLCGEEQLIQVCADLGDPATKEREARALLASAADHPRAHLVIATLTPEAALGVPPEVLVVDAALWLLGPNQPS